jgi:hypothetical protein
VFQVARQHVANRLESAMRMIRRAFRLTGRNFYWPHLVKQQERIELRKRRLWERAADQKAPAF